MDSNNATLVEAKKAYTNQLISLLTPQIYEGIKHIYETGRQNMKGKNIRHSFQLELQDVSLWNQIVIDKETERIIENTQCKYLDKLVTVIFINSTKILASAYIGNHATNTLEISVPKLAHFIHFVYIETAKEFYKNPYLFDENIPSREKQDNLRSSIECIKTGIEQAILKLLPIEDILNRDISTDLPHEELKQLEGDVLDPTLVEGEDESEPTLVGGEDESEQTLVEGEEVNQGRESPLNVEDIPDEEEVQVEEQNFVKRTLSSDGTGIDVEKVNEDNKEFIEKNKDSSDLVDNLVDTINLKNIDLSSEDSGKLKNNNEVTVNKLDEQQEQQEQQEHQEHQEQQVTEVNQEHQVTEVNQEHQEQHVKQEHHEQESTVAEEMNHVMNSSPIDSEQVMVGGDSDIALEVGEDTTTELEGDLEAGEDFVQESLEVGEVNDDTFPQVAGVNEVEVVDDVNESIREEAENMLSNLKQDLETVQQVQPDQPDQPDQQVKQVQQEKHEQSPDEESSEEEEEQSGTRYVNPYRMRRKANERRMQRLKNVKIKKKYLVNY